LVSPTAGFAIKDRKREQGEAAQPLVPAGFPNHRVGEVAVQLLLALLSYLLMVSLPMFLDLVWKPV